MHYRIDIEKSCEIIENYFKGIKSEVPKKPKEKKAEVAEVYPEWFNQKAWNFWVEYRAEIKKKLTPKTRQMQLAFLERNKEDHVEIIKRSIMNGWQGLFEIKKVTPGGRNGDEIRRMQKKIEYEKEQREKAEVYKNNERLRTLSDQVALLGNKMKMNHE